MIELGEVSEMRIRDTIIPAMYESLKYMLSDRFSHHFSLHPTKTVGEQINDEISLSQYWHEFYLFTYEDFCDAWKNKDAVVQCFFDEFHSLQSENILLSTSQRIVRVEDMGDESSIVKMFRKISRIAESCNKYQEMVDHCPIHLSNDYHVGTRTIFCPQSMDDFISFSEDRLVTSSSLPRFYHAFEWHEYLVEETEAFKKIKNHTRNDCHVDLALLKKRIGTAQEQESDKALLKVLKIRIDHSTPEQETYVIQERIRLLEQPNFSKALEHIGVKHHEGCKELLLLMTELYQKRDFFIKGKVLEERLGKSKSSIHRITKPLQTKDLINNQNEKNLEKGYFLTHQFFEKIKEYTKLL